MLRAAQLFADEISARVYRGVMVLALHQNTEGKFGIRSYRDDDHFIPFAADIFVNPSARNDDFAYVTTRGWFELLKHGGWNVVLQDNTAYNDGSLSYATAERTLPYVNIETQLGDVDTHATMIRTVNRLITEYPRLATDTHFIA